MNPVRLIERKRDGEAHTYEELLFLSRAAATGDGMSPEQLAAWLMAVVWRGMTFDETAHLTMAMVESGSRLDLTGLPEPWLDKHSTGGVGDKTTLVLLPLLAACGVSVVKMSGRGLGITGGTIDKLESIPGFRTALSLDEMKSQAGRIGLALTGQTPDLAPADKALYALRDVTGTVRSIPLIASSVMSKKVAGGARVIGIDLKCGRGAFMANLDEARELGQVMVEIGRRCGVTVGIEITDMDQPLGFACGNALEVNEAIATLEGANPGGFRDFCVALADSLLQLAGHPVGAAEALSSGRARENWSRWMQAQGGVDGSVAVDSLVSELLAGSSGWVSGVDARLVGEAVLELGGGRKQREDVIRPGVGIELLKKVGDPIASGEPWARVYGEPLPTPLAQAITISSEPLAARPLILERLNAD